MKLVKETIDINYLYEEKIGDYHYRDRYGESYFIDVYKNPSSIKHMEHNIRGISDKDGNFYIVNKSNILHDRILDFLKGKDILTNTGWDNNNYYYKGCIAWQRLHGTNELYLGETYSENMNVIHLDWFKDMYNNVIEKNKSIEFILKSIYDK